MQAELPKKTICISRPPGHVEKPDLIYHIWLWYIRSCSFCTACRKVSGRCLHVTWSYLLESQGFKKAGYEDLMWSRKDKDGDNILVATHVDDSIVTGSDHDKTDTFVREMLDRFDGTCERNPHRNTWYGMGARHRGGHWHFASEGLHGAAAENFRFLAIQ